MTGDALAVGFLNLSAAKVDDEYRLVGAPNVPVYVDRVPDDPEFPYVYMLTNFPTVGERSQARSVHVRHLRSRTVVVGLTAASVRIVAQKLSNALEGKRPVVAGWSMGRIESEPNEQPIQPDTDVTIQGTSEHPLYQPFDWILTGSQT